MPFKSKAQARLFFAKNPEKAREWAHETAGGIKSLPEKKHPEKNKKKKKLPAKIAGDGMFAKRAVNEAPAQARFFQEMIGRDDGLFHEKSAAAGDVPKPHTTEASSKEHGGSSTNIAIGGQAFRGEGTSGGMYGTGDGESRDSEKRKSDEDRLRELLAGAGPGEERKADDGEKTAGKTPTEWDADSALPVGFHRPASEQPEALEAGGNRFHSTESMPPDYGSGEGFSHSTPTESEPLAKAASVAVPRYLGTSFAMRKHAAVGEYAAERGREFTESLGRAARGVAERADEGARSITRSPAGSVLAAALLARFGFRGAKGLGRKARSLGRFARGKPPVPKKPKGIIEGIGAAARGLAAKFK